MLRVWFLGFLYYDVTSKLVTSLTLVSGFLAGLGSGGEGKRVEVVVPTPQPLPMAGTDANLTDSSGRIDSSARGKFVCPFQFLS
jgi:hypothetical protein